MKDIDKKELAFLIGKNDPLIFDVGCYDGSDAAQLALNFDSPVIHCFEADPRSADLFKRLYRRNEKLILHEFALGSFDGQADFYLSDSDTRRHFETQKSWSASSSIKSPKTHLDLFPDVYFMNMIKVKMQKLDSWFFREIYLYNPREVVDLIWCDVNGGEGDFIDGGFHTLNEHTRFLYIETSDKELYTGQIRRKELLSELYSFEVIGEYNKGDNFSNLLLKNKHL